MNYACEEKIDYGSWSAAEKVSKRSRMKNRTGGVILFPYHCRDCGGYHLASREKLVRQRYKRERLRLRIAA